MLSYLTASDIANTVRLTRTLHSGAIVIAEGDTDVRVYKRFFHESLCRIVPANGKATAIQAAMILDGALTGVVTIVDADFDRLESVSPPTPNILYTDTHDLETMILNSSSFTKILNELTSASKCKKLGKPVLDLVIQAGLPLAHLRWLSTTKRDNLNLRFKGMDFHRFVRLPSLSTDITAMIREAVSNTSGCSVNLNLIEVNLKTIMAIGSDPWQVCCGHDLVQILLMGLTATFGNSKAGKVTLAILDAMIRVAYEKDDFQGTALYEAIVVWQKNNNSYQVLE